MSTHTPINPQKLLGLHWVRKPMPPPSQVMGERKRKNAYRRKEKFKTDFLQDSP